MNLEITGSSRSKCRVCDEPPRIAFNWRFAQEDTRHTLHALFEQLQEVGSLKFGYLFACRICGLNWYLDGDRSTMTRVSEDERDILNQWNENQLLIEQDHLRVLDAIGGTAPGIGSGTAG